MNMNMKMRNIDCYGSGNAKLLSLIVFVILFVGISSCGKEKGSEKYESPAKADGDTLIMTKISGIDVEKENGLYPFNHVSKCQLEKESKLLTIELSHLTNKNSSLIVKVRNADVGKYSCIQDINNMGNSLGFIYNNCYIHLSIPSSEKTDTFNAYTIARNNLLIDNFLYSGTCVITILSLSPAVKASINCIDMIQVQRNGLFVNPISTARKASLVVDDLSCNDI